MVVKSPIWAAQRFIELRGRWSAQCSLTGAVIVTPIAALSSLAGAALELRRPRDSRQVAVAVFFNMRSENYADSSPKLFSRGRAGIAPPAPRTEGRVACASAA
jgi:hypothetical protein